MPHQVNKPPIDLSKPGELGFLLKALGSAKGKVVVRKDCQADPAFVTEMGLGCGLSEYAQMFGGTESILRIAAYCCEDLNEHGLAEILRKAMDW